MKKMIFFVFVLYSNMSVLLTAIEPTDINFKPVEMRVMSLEQWHLKNENLPAITQALAEYQATGVFTQTLAEYRENPEAYFSARLTALERLLATIDLSMTSGSTLKKLRQQAVNKLLYIRHLPSMRHPLLNKQGVLEPEQKNISMLEKYGRENLDPLHRRKKMGVYTNRWLASDIPNYFIYIDSVEADPLFAKFAPQGIQVTYCNSEKERSRHRLDFVNGLIYQEGNLFDTLDYNASYNGSGIAIFVLGLDGHFYARNEDKAGSIHHSSEFAGGDVLCAGEMTVVKGKIKMINNHSGHYCPEAFSLQIALRSLSEKIGSLKDIDYVAYESKNDYLFFYPPLDFLQQGLSALPIPLPEYFPLHFAIIEDLSSWISLADDPNLLLKERQGETPLHVAARLGKSEWVRELLKYGASVENLTSDGLTPLELSAASGDIKTFDLLYRVTADPEARGRAVLYAAKSGNLSLLQQVESGNNLYVQDTLGNTIFHYAAQAPKADALIYLLKRTSETLANQRNRAGETPLHYAAGFGTKETVSFLINLGLSPLNTDFNGNTALHFSADKGNVETMEYFIDQFPRTAFLVGNYQNVLPLHLGAILLPVTTYQRLVEKTNWIDKEDVDGNTPLFYAVNSPEKAAQANVCVLLEKGANPLKKNRCGWNPLHSAVSGYKRLISAAELLTFYDSLEETTDEGDLPLHLAVKFGDKQIVRYLFQYATEDQLLHRNNSGVTALDLLKERTDLSR